MKPQSKCGAVAVCFLFCLPNALRADWDPGDPFAVHFPQLPDLTADGLDVSAGPALFGPGPPPPPVSLIDKFLADDWRATADGPVTGIHYWGSYFQDIKLIDPPQSAYFSLVIYDNIPASGGEPSRPGEPLWDIYLQPTAARLFDTADEGFYDPFKDEVVGADTEVWQFNFEIPAADAFVQTDGEIYWLGVHHTFDLDGDGDVDGNDFLTIQFSSAAFGWKTSQDHFEDAAVWAGFEFASTTDPHVVPDGTTTWSPLDYPTGHALDGMPMDMAFVISIPEPSTISLAILGVVGLTLTARKRD